MSQNIQPFTWGAIQLNETTHINGMPHVTRRAIGEWLEYADPQKAIDNLLERNSYIEAHSTPLNMRGTDGKSYDTKVYHPIGFLLIVMESGQPKAQAMKQAVAEFVWHFAGPQTLTFKERMELNKMLLCWNKVRSDAKTEREAEMADNNIAELCFQLGQPNPSPEKSYLALKQPSLALNGGES